MVFSIINHPFGGTPIYGKPPKIAPAQLAFSKRWPLGSAGTET